MRPSSVLKRAALIIILLAAPSLSAQTTNTVSYTYDTLGRLASATYPGTGHTVSITYTYDNAGNRTVQTVSGVNPPACSNLSSSVSAGSNVSIPALSSCTDPQGYTITLASVSPTSSALGTASVSGSNISFTAAAGTSGQTANLTWTTSDPYGVTTTAQATVTIH